MTANVPQADLWAQLPRTTLNFSHPVPLTGIPPSPFIVNPLQCSPDGTAFLQIPLPPTFMTRALVSITKRGTAMIKTSGTTPAGYDEFRLIAYFPRDEEVYALAEGRKHASHQPTDSNPPWQELILKYAEDGSLASASPLQISFVPLRFAVLPSGRLIVIGQESTNQSPDLVLLDGDGANPQALDLFGSGLYGAESLRQFFPGMDTEDSVGSAMSRVIDSVQFVSHGKEVLLVQTGANFPIVEIGDAGIVRTVRLALPSGTTVESVLPASGTTYLYVRVANHRAVPATHKLIVFDSDTGQAVRQISISGLTTVESIACDSDGTFLGLRKVFANRDDKGTWNLLTASE